MSYAENTTLSIDKSRSEIERTLKRYGASSFAYGWEGHRAVVQFSAHNRHVRFVLPMPQSHDRQYTHTPTGQRRAPQAMNAVLEKAQRQRWRGLVLVIKAKLEAVESGISEFESEFLANIVLPNGATVGDFMAPQIEDAYESGTMPRLLPALGAGA
jgi:hypothetical protein